VIAWCVPSVRSFVLLLSCLSLLALLSSCEGSSTLPRTQLVLVVDTDIAELDEVTFLVTSPTGKAQTARGAIVPGAPAFVVMAHQSGATLGPYQVSVEGLAAGNALIRRVASLSFVAGRTRAALFHLVRACQDVVCRPELVCAHAQGCRVAALDPGELVPWYGKPPRLSAEVDAGTTDNDAGSDNDAGGSACKTTCDGNDVRLCQGGVLGATQPCTGMDLCSVPACSDGVGCVREPSNEGKSCGGPGLRCHDGICGAGQSCTKTCSPQCNTGALSCALDCGDIGDDCKPTCLAGSSCDVLCSGSSNCAVSCDGNCAVSCGKASNCDVTCRAGSSCDIDCTGEGNCDKTQCDGNAICVLRCGQNDNCAFNHCMGGKPIDCGDGVFVCHGTCP